MKLQTPLFLSISLFSTTFYKDKLPEQAGMNLANLVLQLF
jgi:hypothetical protein